MRFSCRGCQRTFNRQADFVQHLRKTQHLLCLQVREEIAQRTRERPIRSNTPRSSKDRREWRSSSPSMKSESDQSTKVNGDFFGSDYAEEDFPYPPANEGDEPESDREQADEPMVDLSQVCEGHAPVDEVEEETDPLFAEADDLAAMEASQPQADPLREDTPHDDPNRMQEDPPHDDQNQMLSDDFPGERPRAAANAVPRPVYIDHFRGRAGEIIPGVEENPGARSAYHDYTTRLTMCGNQETDQWAPFVSRIDWEVARWAKLRGSGSTSFSELLEIPGVCEKLGLSYKNTPELNKIVDSLPGPRPAFEHHQVDVAGETFDFFARDIIECIQALLGDPEHAQYLCFAPERHYADADKTERVYHDMQTGKWWWGTQVELEKEKPGATIIPVIISSDKTQLTLFGNKSAYPVYLTIGNLPKSIRRKPSRQGQILLAYLPTTRLTHISNKSARRRTLANLFHACLGHIVQPLHEAGVNGITVVTGDGVIRRGHPILACYVGDYPEQCMVTGAYTGDCPVCDCPHDELGVHPFDAPFRDLDVILDALEQLGSLSYSAACKDARIKPLQRPFWAGLPYVNIFQCITPDILHQLYQGVVKHLVSWLTTICGAAEIDARVRRVPPNHSIRIFQKGITCLL